MRNAVLKSVYKIMSQDKNVYFLTADLGYTAVEEIEKDFPKRFINVGVAEQNLIGISAGLAKSGKKVFIYSIVPFVTMRCYEQIRNDICYHNLNINIIGVGSGLSYGLLGNTHFGTEDIGIIRCLPNIAIISPADPVEAGLATSSAFKHSGPVYLRIGKKGEPTIYEKSYSFSLGKPVVLRKGKDITIFSTGNIISHVLKSASVLTEKHNIHPHVINIHTIKPLETDTIKTSVKDKKLAVTVEEHGIIGGLGSAVSEILSQEQNMPPLKIIGIKNEFIKHIGTQEYLRHKLGLDYSGITKTILQSYSEIS